MFDWDLTKASASLASFCINGYVYFTLIIQRELELEKKRKDTIPEKTTGSEFWFDEPIDGMDVTELEQYLSSLQELKRKVLTQVHELMMMNNAPALFGSNLNNNTPTQGPNVLRGLQDMDRMLCKGRALPVPKTPWSDLVTNEDHKVFQKELGQNLEHNVLMATLVVASWGILFSDEAVKETQEFRPMGDDRAKVKKKAAGSSREGASSFVDLKAEARKIAQLKREKLEIQRRTLELAEREKRDRDILFYNSVIDQNLPPIQQQKVLEMKMEIKARYKFDDHKSVECQLTSILVFTFTETWTTWGCVPREKKNQMWLCFKVGVLEDEGVGASQLNIANRFTREASMSPRSFVPFVMKTLKRLITFFTCEVASNLWSVLAKWWEVDIPFCANIEDWFSWLDTSSFSKK
ncbi:hypothetical protein Tco_0947135, partial [Tanacetum coccineum]